MIASLPMYDRAETRAAGDRLWAGIRDHLRDAGIDAPETLTRGGDPWDDWRAPDLLLSQTCGLPYRARLHDRVTLVAAPVHPLPGLPPGRYCSVLVARADDPRGGIAAFDGATLAVNDPLSQSGWAAPWALAAGEGIAFAVAGPTGSHRASARAVAEGGADLAALDVVSWTMIARWDRDLAGALRDIARTPPTPALPYITAAGRDPAPIRAALAAAVAEIPPADREALCLAGVTAIAPRDYLDQPLPPPLP